MFRLAAIPLLLLLISACTSNKKPAEETEVQWDVTIAFGSCNKHDLENQLWDDVLKAKPDLWIWGGDNIYADTSDMEVMRNMYAKQDKVRGYRKLKREVPVIGTWDDHDYGLNDAGLEFDKKAESQQAFLDFLAVPQNSPRRSRQGVYAAHQIGTRLGMVKILVLDTRYFRSSLTDATEEGKRFQPGPYGEGTLLGEQQWSWLEAELQSSEADFNLLVSSIQFLSDQHGFECWGNFPHETERLKQLLLKTGAANTVIVSGDRHISEFSKTKLDGLPYPLIDFTSSGLTHPYSDFDGEANPYRIGNVISEKSFGLLRFNFSKNEVRMQMVGDEGVIYQEIRQTY
ncbi:alkaline phosphatase D family protein [Poritiphilus flavus]|uniref:Alkaline phosphatase family protein n=1 Tax=Poritiphilus flavus TaxID=2697053 RepID=A0A6L9E9E4_9FLAO|nr:alkaline phosphatase D family protein [Poritiphilus flavus]NAS11387.1 alkaline phosphatase family protein [Poritiphilus flavus]